MAKEKKPPQLDWLGRPIRANPIARKAKLVPRVPPNKGTRAPKRKSK